MKQFIYTSFESLDAMAMEGVSKDGAGTEAEITAPGKEDVTGQLDTSNDGGIIGDVPSMDDTFEILRNKRRRQIVRLFNTQETSQLTLSDLAEEIAAKELDKSVAELTSAERKRVYVSLYQCHLPKMDAMGVVDFDSDRKIVAPTRSIPYLAENLSFAHRQSTATEGGPQWRGHPMRLGEHVVVFMACLIAAVTINIAAATGAGVLLVLAGVRAARSVDLPGSSGQ